MTVFTHRCIMFLLLFLLVISPNRLRFVLEIGYDNLLAINSLSIHILFAFCLFAILLLDKFFRLFKKLTILVNYKLKLAQWWFMLTNFILELISKFLNLLFRAINYSKAKEISSLHKISDKKYFYKYFLFINKTALFTSLTINFSTGLMAILSIEDRQFLWFNSIDLQAILFNNTLLSEQIFINIHHVSGNFVMWFTILHVLNFALIRYKLFKFKQSKR